MSQLQWLVTLTTLLLVAGLTLLSPIAIRTDGITLNHLFGAIFGIVALVYTYVRVDLRVAALCDAVAQLAVFILVGGVASYLAAYYGGASAFWDGRLLAFDRSLGFDWLAYLHLMAAHPGWAALLNTAYLSILWQAVALIAVLVVCGQYARLQTFILAFQVAALVCVAGSALMPALGAYAYLGVSMARDHPDLGLATMDHYVATLMQLRGPHPSLPTGTIEGIVTFPSLHMGLAVLFVWGFWRVAWIRWGALLLNGLMMLATPLSGSHYLADLLAGTLVAILALAIASHARRRLYAPAETVLPRGGAPRALAA